MRAIRLHHGHRSASDYGGSLIVPSRWNPPGTPMLYCSTTLSLACLEILVHLSPDEIPAGYAYSAAEFEDDPETAGFRGALSDLDSTRRYGHAWASSRRSLALLVPSVVVPVEFNLLLNPTHSRFPDVIWGPPAPFEFDPRLLRKSGAAD